MNFNEYSLALCTLPQAGTGTGTSTACPAQDSRCADPEWAADHLDVCPGAASITGLEVIPTTNDINVGGKAAYRAYLQFSDGQGLDVTEKSAWTAADAAIAIVDAHGLATGESEGSTFITAEYRGLAASATLTVAAACDQAGMDIVLVFDVSAGMGQTYPELKRLGGYQKSLLDLCKEGARSLVASARLPSVDRIGIVSASGIFDEYGTTNYTHDAQVCLGLSGVQDDILAAIDTLQVVGCAQNPMGAMMCDTGLGAGLEVAKTELLANGRSSARKVIILVTIGYEVEGVPDPVTVASDIHALNWTLEAIVPYPSTDYVTRHGVHLNNWDYMSGLVSCDFFFASSDGSHVSQLFASALPAICAKQGDACLYYVPWAGTPPPTVRYRDQLDYDGLTNWDVVKGFVDLIGVDLYPLQPGYGLFLDMVGTDQEHTDLTEKDAVGAIQSKQSFNFAPGRYRLTFDVAGNLRFPSPSMSLHVTAGALLDKIVTVTDWKQPFTTYTYDFSVSSARTAMLKFEHMPVTGKWVPTIGLLLDNVKLKNLDTGAVLLDDDFDDENPIP